MDLITISLLAVLVAWLAIVAIALRDIWSTVELNDTGRLGWTLAVVFAPVLGTIAWFVTRPRRPSLSGRR